jgi:queuine tRNA-ribosyltransferase
MGLGDTEGLLEAIAQGADMFDCVLPTRLARHGKALTRSGDLNLRNAVFESDDQPIDEECDCRTCATHSRAYLRHLVRVKELSAHRLLTIHNLRYTLDLISGAGDAIEARGVLGLSGPGGRATVGRFVVGVSRRLTSPGLMHPIGRTN